MPTSLIQNCIAQNNDLLALLNKAKSSLSQAISNTLKAQTLLNGLSVGTSTNASADTATCVLENNDTMALLKVLDPYLVQSATDVGELSISLVDFQSSIPTPPILGVPKSMFVATPTGLIVVLRDASTDVGSTLSIVSYDTGDGFTVTSAPGATVTYTYASAGTYSIVETVTDATGQTATSTQSITVAVPVTPPQPTLVIQFVATVAAGYVVTVQDTSTGTLSTDSLSISWGYGKPSPCVLGGNVSFTYPNASQYMITATITRNGVATSVAHPVYPGTPTGSTPVSPPPPPPPPPPDTASAAFTASADGADVTITDTTAGAVSEAWDYGDGTKDTIVGNHDHTYTTNGTYTIALDAVGKDGAPSTATQQVDVTIPVAPPGATGMDKVKIRTTVAQVGRRVILSCWAVPNGSQVASVSIDWGDGSAAQPLNLIYQATKHDYSADGNYTITISAIAQNSDWGVWTDAVSLAQLTEPPDPVVTANGVANLTATLAGNIPVDVTLNAGQRVPLVASNPALGSIVFHADGKSVCVEDMYEISTNDLAGHFKLNASGVKLWDDLEVIWVHSRTRPFWITPPTVLPTVDLTKFGKWGTAGAGASLLDNYLAADNGPMGVSFQPPGIGNGGEREELGGPLQEADAIYCVNPTADNAIVVFGLADAFAPQPCGLIDSKTNKMLDVTQYPNATLQPSMLSGMPGGNGNPIVPFTSNTPLSLSQAWTHATPACALAAELSDADYYKEQLSLWANHVGSLWQNPAYRLPAGCIGTGGAARGKGRTLTVVQYAAILSDSKPYFAAWVDALADVFNTTFPTQNGIQIDQLAAASEGYQGHAAYAGWQQGILTHAIGQAIKNGYTKFQTTFDYFATYFMDAMLIGPHELLTIYNINWKDTAGNIATDYANAMQITGTYQPTIAAALLCAEGSAALQTALGYPSHLPGDFAAGDPTSSSNYIAQVQGTYALIANLATDQIRAQAAYSRFMQYNRVNYTNSPKYDLVA